MIVVVLQIQRLYILRVSLFGWQFVVFGSGRKPISPFCQGWPAARNIGFITIALRTYSRCTVVRHILRFDRTIFLQPVKTLQRCSHIFPKCCVFHGLLSFPDIVFIFFASLELRSNIVSSSSSIFVNDETLLIPEWNRFERSSR